jgi:glucosamine--fructose-6-phosphate aminotransferase (isomerizing)
MGKKITSIHELLKGVQPRTAHPFLMYENIINTPKLMNECLDSDSLGTLKKVALLIERKGIKKLFFCGFRSSLFAGEILGLGFDQKVNIPYATANPFEMQHYLPSDLNKNSAVVIISSSGNTSLIQKVAELAHNKGAMIIVLTDNPDKGIFPMADHVIFGCGGIDLIVSKTRGFSTALIRGYMLIAYLLEHKQPTTFFEEAKILPAIAEKSIVQNEESIIEIAASWSNVKKVLSVGIGPNIWAAQETALTMMKTNGIPSLAFEMEEFCHGPELTLNSSTGVILFQSGAIGIEKTNTVANAVVVAGAKLVIISDSQNAEWPNEAVKIFVPKMDELFTPSVMILPAQLLVYYLAIKLGRNPDLGGVVDNPQILEVINTLHP